MSEIMVDPRVSKPIKFDDRPGHVTEYAKRMGISEHQPSEGNKRFQEMVHSMKATAPAYVVDPDGAQKMANSRPFFIEKTTLGRARDIGRWIVGVGDEAGGSFQVGLLEECWKTGEEVPRRRWPHNAYRCEN
jgi:hypothetical protein